jgi:putative DNA primase/helicase
MNISPVPQLNGNNSGLAPLALPVTGQLQGFEPVEPWPDPVQGHLLLDALVAQLSRFVVFPEHAAETFALWIVHTFLFRCRSICTYIAVESPEKECGKSTLIKVLSQLVDRPIVSSNMTSSSFFHLIAEFSPTLLIDEADVNLRGRAELRSILNAGYLKSNAFVWRMAYESTPEPVPDAHSWLPATPHRREVNTGHSVPYTCWCPKAIASIGRVDDILASRCIVTYLHRKTEAEVCERLKYLDGTPFKRQCARFAADHAAAIAAAEPIMPAGLANRAADIWEPLFAIADLAGSRWPQLARQAALAFTTVAHDRSPIGSLLLDIGAVFGEHQAERLFSRDLVSELNCRADRPWAELRHGRAIDELWLAKQLRPYGIFPRSMRIGETKTKGYTLEELRPIFKRYIPQDEKNASKEETREANASESPKPPLDDFVI